MGGVFLFWRRLTAAKESSFSISPARLSVDNLADLIEMCETEEISAVAIEVDMHLNGFYWIYL